MLTKFFFVFLKIPIILLKTHYNTSNIDLYQYFENEDPLDIINKFIIPGDVHWNEYGHKYIYDMIMKGYFKNNSKDLNN